MNFYVVAVYYQLLVLLELIQHSVLHRFVAVAADEPKKEELLIIYFSHPSFYTPIAYISGNFNQINAATLYIKI